MGAATQLVVQSENKLVEVDLGAVQTSLQVQGARIH